MVSIEERAKVFEKELELIFDENIREFTRLCLFEAPDYFFTDCPASSSGKYHPISELGPDGTMLHTKKIFTLAYTLCRGMGVEHHRDEILAAAIIHDLRKQGLTKTGHTTKSHPGLAADLVEKVQEATQLLTEKSYEIIRNSCGYHYGPWSQHPWQKPLNEYTMEELCVYISDYVVSKREVEINYKR